MSIFVEMTRTERNLIVDRLKTERNNHQSEARLHEWQLRNWERGMSQYEVSPDPSIHKKMKERYRKNLCHHEERVRGIDRLISKLHAH